MSPLHLMQARWLTLGRLFSKARTVGKQWLQLYRAAGATRLDARRAHGLEHGAESVENLP